MGLEVNYGDKINPVAKEPDVDEAIAQLIPLLREGLGDEGAKPAPASMTISDIATPPPRPHSENPNLLLGVTASPGLAVGNIFQMRREDINTVSGSAFAAASPAIRKQYLFCLVWALTSYASYAYGELAQLLPRAADANFSYALFHLESFGKTFKQTACVEKPENPV